MIFVAALVAVSIFTLHQLGLLPPQLTAWLSGWNLSTALYIAGIVFLIALFFPHKWVKRALFFIAVMIFAIALGFSGTWQKFATKLEDLDACARNPYSAACARVEASKPNAPMDGRWEKVIHGKEYAVKDNEWLIFTRPAKKCISIKPPEALEVRFLGNEVWIRSRSGTRFIVPCILHIGEADADGDVCV